MSEQKHEDSGTEFSRAFNSLENRSIIKTKATAYTPESDGLIEEIHGVLLSMVQTCLAKSKFQSHSVILHCNR